jgi:hypothetical protein
MKFVLSTSLFAIVYTTSGQNDCETFQVDEHLGGDYNALEFDQDELNSSGSDTITACLESKTLSVKSTEGCEFTFHESSKEELKKFKQKIVSLPYAQRGGHFVVACLTTPMNNDPQFKEKVRASVNEQNANVLIKGDKMELTCKSRWSLKPSATYITKKSDPIYNYLFASHSVTLLKTPLEYMFGRFGYKVAYNEENAKRLCHEVLGYKNKLTELLNSVNED